VNIDSYITVMQVFNAMGIKPDKSTSWSVGSMIASEFANEFGHQPPKDNRPKTSGSGTHCFALYPRSWEPRIRAVIAKHVTAQSAQGGLF
jgi:hypothetical protein